MFNNDRSIHVHKNKDIDNEPEIILEYITVMKVHIQCICTCTVCYLR